MLEEALGAAGRISVNVEELLAEMARRDNLAKVNAGSAPVFPRDSFYVRYGKRIADLLIAVPANIVLLPVYGVLAVCVYRDVGSPVIFKQLRTGKDGKAFNLIKFRSMTDERDEGGQLLPASERATDLGRFLREKSLDELPSLLLVLKGDMSIIGPRPLPATFEGRYSERHKMRNAVKPGLECPTLGSDGHVRLYQEQFENDIWYVENVSLSVDVRMFLQLFKMVFNKKERKDHAVVSGGSFVGYDDNGDAFSMRRVPERFMNEVKALVSGGGAHV